MDSSESSKHATAVMNHYLSKKYRRPLQKKVHHWNTFETTYQVKGFSSFPNRCHDLTLKLEATIHHPSGAQQEILHYCTTCDTLKKGYFARVRNRHREIKEIRAKQS